MSALDLTWHWGKGFLYISLMSRIVLVMEGLDQNKYQIPGKILKLFAFEIVAYFLLTPVLDLVTTRADHRLYQFIDERQTLPVYVCGEVIEYWISFLLAFGDLILCSTTIGVYLYAVGEMIIEPISNQKLIDICIRYAIFSIFASIFIMIGNGVWATNSFSTARYIDVIFCVFSIMYLLTVCTSCYNSCCSNCHKKLRTSYITHFLYIKEGLILKEFNEIRNNPKYVLKSYDRSFDQKLTQILESANLANHDSLDTYHQNVALHHAHSNIKSKKKLKKIKKRILKQQQLRGKDGKQTPNVNLNDRELQAIARLVEFSSKNRSAMNSMRHLSTTTGMQSNQSESKESSQTGTNTTKDNNSNILTPSVNINDDGFEYNEYSAINANLGINPEDSAIISIKKGVKKKKKKKIGYKNVGLLAKLNPDDSHLPKSLTIAIHASVIDTVKLDKESKEMTEREKIDKKMDELYTKVDTYWDENIILFPRRSPTIYPGQAYKLTKAEKFALQERKEEIEKQEYSDPDNYSDEFNDSDDEELQTQEREWSKSARKHGDGKNLDHIYEILEDIEDKDLLTIWDLLDKENQKKVDYRDGLVKLLGAFFLLYFRKKAYNGDGGYTQIHEQPPKFNELEPVLVLLAKFIRDTLRKKKKKFLKKSDYQKNFKKYLREAIEKRNKFLDKRKNKLKSQSSLVSMTSNNGHIIMDNMNTNTSSPNMNGYVTSFTTNGLSSVSEYKIEEEDDEYDDKMMAALSKDGMGMKGMKMKLPNTNLPTIMSEGWNKIEEEEPNEDNKLDTADHDDMMAALDHFDAFVDDDKKHRNKQKNERQESRFNDDEAAQIELQKMMDNYTPRESTNKLMMKKIYKEEEEEAKYQDPKLKIDAQMAELQKRRAKHQQQLSDKGTVNMTLLMNGNAKQNKNKNTLTTIVDNDNPWNDKDKKQNSNPTEIDMDIDSIDVTNILNNINDADDTPIVSLTTPVQQQQQPTTGDTGFDSDVDIDAIRLSDAAERKEQEEKEKKEANNKDLLPSTDINETGKSSSLFDVDDLLQHVDSQDLVIPPDTPTSPTVTEHEQQHNKDARSDATEIFNPNAIEPKKHKVVVIDEKNIKQENEEEYQDSKGKDNNNHTQQESLKVTDDLMNAALSAMDSNNNSDKHETNETMVEIKQDNNNNNKSNNNTMASMELDQGFMNDVLSNIDMGDD